MTYKGSQLHKQRTKATQTDSRQRKVESEKLDGYGWMMSLDSVRTPEEILLVKQRLERLERQIDRLQPRIGRVLRLRMGINCKGHTLDEVAEQYGVTKERVRQMEAKAVRIVKRQVWIEERPEEYRRQCEAQAKAYAERKRLEREIEMEKLRGAELKPVIETTEDRQRREHYEAQKRADENRQRRERYEAENRAIVAEILAPVQEYRGFAGGRERTLLPASVLYGNREWHPYLYKLQHVPIKRDWLNVATEGFRDGA